MVHMTADSLTGLRPRTLAGEAPLARQRRVWILVGSVTALSVADLLLTITHATSPFGMVELNPLARWLLEHGSVHALVAFKLITVAFTVVLLHVARKTDLGELASWVCFGVLVVLCLHWVQYNAMICDLIWEKPGVWEDLCLSAAGDLWVKVP